jgi:hypothetical protein
MEEKKMTFLDATPEKIGTIASKAQYIQDLCNAWLANKEFPIDGEKPLPDIPRTLADDILRQLQNIADSIGPYCEDDE